MKYDLSQMKDSSLKLRIRRILWAQGFHCPLEVDLSHFDYQDAAQILKRSSLTDIDVLGIRFEPDLRMTTIIADCKSGRDSESTRIFWLRGVMDFFGAQEGIFVKKSLHSQARSIAPRLGIRAIDEKGLDALEKSLALDILSVDIGDPSIYSKTSSLWGIEIESGQKPTDRQSVVKYIYQYLQYYYWVVDEYRNIQNLVDLFNRIRNDIYVNNIKSKYLVYIGLQRLTLSILRMASSVAAVDMTNIRVQSHTYLFGGAFLQHERTQIIDLLNKLIEQDGIGEKIKLEPAYFDELVEIVNRIILNSLQAIKILQHLDAVIMEYILGSTQDIQRVLGQSYSTDALVLMKRIASMFQKHAGFDEGMFEELRSL
jgi:hypothetical protein